MTWIRVFSCILKILFDDTVLFLRILQDSKENLCNIRPNTTQRRSVEKVPNNDWQASVTLILLVFHRLDLAS